MPHLYLPSDHSEADLVLAAQVAAAVQSDELWVAWSEETGAAAPEIEALVREPVHPFAEALAALCVGLLALVRLLAGRPAPGALPPAPDRTREDEQPRPV